MLYILHTRAGRRNQHLVLLHTVEKVDISLLPEGHDQLENAFPLFACLLPALSRGWFGSFMSFPVPHTERSDVTINHLPQQLAPSWCTKPQDTWMAGAGVDIGTDSDDAGPFRWFIDERSLSAPGELFLSLGVRKMICAVAYINGGQDLEGFSGSHLPHAPTAKG